MKIRGYLRVGYNTTLNIVLYALTRGNYLWLEGRVRRGVYRNWAREFRYAPATFVRPSKEEELVRIVERSAKVRVFGSGHSFNEGNVSDHLYVFPFTEECQVNTWNHTHQHHSPNAVIREFSNISRDALLAAWVGGLLADAKLLRFSSCWSRLSYLVRRGSDLVLESDCAFNRTIYHLHQELEFAVPYEVTFEVCDRLVELYKDMYSSGLPYTLIELRFTPAGHNRTLIGAGQERRSTWIDIVTNDSDGFEAYYAAAVEIVREVGGRPHLGKYSNGFDKKYLQRLYGEHFETFQRLMVRHDPAGKFSNAFTERLFGPNASLTDTSGS